VRGIGEEWKKNETWTLWEKISVEGALAKKKSRKRAGVRNSNARYDGRNHEREKHGKNTGPSMEITAGGIHDGLDTSPRTKTRSALENWCHTRGGNQTKEKCWGNENLQVNVVRKKKKNTREKVSKKKVDSEEL